MRKTVVVLEDDIDGSEATETLGFGLDGVEYEIDLNQGHADELRETLRRYTNAARKVSGGRGRLNREPSNTGPGAKKIRQWALDQGLQVNSRGRIQADIVEKYEAAQR
jgi:Lsr2